jgi:hypothetical protein
MAVEITHGESADESSQRESSRIFTAPVTKRSGFPLIVWAVGSTT